MSAKANNFSFWLTTARCLHMFQTKAFCAIRNLARLYRAPAVREARGVHGIDRALSMKFLSYVARGNWQASLDAFALCALAYCVERLGCVSCKKARWRDDSQVLVSEFPSDFSST